ncbi:MAG: extracellular solute-binding protein [Pseudomonadota bacterium]|nr:extracellular solute-binding protein [Pseudomonadota bacterium]
MTLNRFACTLLCALTAALAGQLRADADERRWHHALSLVGTPKFSADFQRFDYVNPEAPKGGSVRMHAIGTFDSLNQFTIKGNAAAGIGLVHDTLMTESQDEPSTEYGLIAEAVTYPEDFSSVTFRLRQEARFHDGEPVKPEDIIYSLDAIKNVSPNYAFYYKNVVRAEKTGEREVTFRFDVKGNRELPQIVGQLPVLPKHYWTGKDASGQSRDLAKTTLEPVLGSGAYRVKEVQAGRYIVYERVPDYWGKDLPATKGQWNFDEVRIEYFRDTTVAFEAFKAGQIDYYQDSSSKNWATAYDIKAVQAGWIKREEIKLDTPAPMQAFVPNMRRAKFADARVRRAFNLAFDFEASNERLFYGQYKRVSSYFENTELAAQGLPQGRELEILSELKGQIPEEVFAQEYRNPINPDQGALRKNLREAANLLKQAGWTIRDGALTNDKSGEKFTAEFLLVSPLFERIVNPYAQNLKRLGIESTIRIVDSSQYRQRLDSFDFDVVVGVFPQSHSPGNEQRDFWGSDAAGREGSRNLAGIKDPAVDKLIDRIIFATSREELVAACRALDRVLLWSHYVIPQWFSPFARIAYWDRFGHPEKLPSQAVAFSQIWWYDAAKAAKLSAAVN